VQVLTIQKWNFMKTIPYFLAGMIILALIFAVTPAKSMFNLAVSAEQKLAGLIVKTIKITEGEVSYLEGGSGETLLLLHGFGANKDNWNRMAMHLSSDYHIIAPDLPGFGDSFKNPDLDYDVPAQSRRLNELISALGLSQFHLAGNSMGGYIGGNYAADFPERIISLWLLDPLGVSSAPDSEMFTVISEKQRPAVLASNRDEYTNLLSFVFHQPPFMPDFIIDELSNQATANFSLNEKIFEDIHHSADFKVNFTSPLDTQLKGFSKPVLITWGDKDRVLHSQGASELAAIIPNTQIHLMKNIGHLPMLEAPKETAQQFIKFDEAK